VCFLGAIVGSGLEATASPILSYGPEESRAPPSSRMSTVTMLQPDSLRRRIPTCNTLSRLSEPLSMIDIHAQLRMYITCIDKASPIHSRRRILTCNANTREYSQWTGQPYVAEVYVSTTRTHLLAASTFWVI